jgi:hypothetical protein
VLIPGEKASESAGVKTADKTTAPRTEGFQEHVTVYELELEVDLLMQPAILFPFTKKVIFPGAESLVAVKVLL